MSQSAFGKMSTLQDNVAFTFAAMGEAIEPITHMLLDVGIRAAEAIQAILASPLGKWIARITALISAGLIVGGLWLIFLNAGRLGVMKLAMSLSGGTKALMLNTIATKGNVAALKLMGRAAWASLGPYALIVAAVIAAIAIYKKLFDVIQTGNNTVVTFANALLFLAGPVGWLIGLFANVVRGIKSFDDLLGGGKVAEGFIGDLQKIGGLVRGFQALWSSFDAESGTFKISETLLENLEKIGLKDAFLAMSTWIARIKTFFHGFFKGLAEGWDWIGSKVSNFLGDIQPLLDRIPLFEWFLGLFGKNTTDIEKWGAAGRFAASLIISAIGGVADIVLTTIKGILWLGATVSDVFSSIYNFITGAIDKVGEFVDAASNVPLVGGLINGISSFFGDDEQTQVQPALVGGSTFFNEQVGSDVARNSRGGNTVTTNNNTRTETVGSMNVTLEVDGEVMAKKTIDKMNLDNSRQ